MAWKTAVTVLIVVFSATLLWATISDPLVQVSNDLKDVETSGQYDVDSKIDSYTTGYFNMFPILIFGIMAWGIWRIWRRETTRGRL